VGDGEPAPDAVVDDVAVGSDHVARRRRRMPGGRQFRVSVRFTEEERAVVQAAADEAGVTAVNLVAEVALVAARKGGAPVDVRALEELGRCGGFCRRMEAG
jgi:hypothetical protein